MRSLNPLKSVDNSKHTIGIKCHVKSSQQKQTKKVVFVMVVFVVIVFVLVVFVILTFSKYVDNSNNTKSQENSF